MQSSFDYDACHVHVRRSRWTKLSSYIFPKLIFFEFNISNNFNGIEISPLLNCFNLISRLTILVANFDIKSIQHLQDLINIFHIYSLTTNISLRFPFKFLKKTLTNPVHRNLDNTRNQAPKIEILGTVAYPRHFSILTLLCGRATILLLLLFLAGNKGRQTSVAEREGLRDRQDNEAQTLSPSFPVPLIGKE